jgi:hypothetical protein
LLDQYDAVEIQARAVAASAARTVAASAAITQRLSSRRRIRMSSLLSQLLLQEQLRVLRTAERAVSRSASKRPPNTEISCEDRAILAFAGFVSFISLLAGMLIAPTSLDQLCEARPGPCNETEENRKPDCATEDDRCVAPTLETRCEEGDEWRGVNCHGIGHPICHD